MNKCVYRRACYVFFRLSGLFVFVFFSFFEGIVLLSICICFLGNSKFSHSLCSSLCRKKISPIIIFFRNVWLHRWKPGKLRNTFLSFRKQFLKITFSFCWSGMNLSIGGLDCIFCAGLMDWMKRSNFGGNCWKVKLWWIDQITPQHHRSTFLILREDQVIIGASKKKMIMMLKMGWNHNINRASESKIWETAVIADDW